MSGMMQQGASTFTRDELVAYRGRLCSMRTGAVGAIEALKSSLAFMESDAAKVIYGEDEPMLAQRSSSSVMLDSARRSLDDINAAVARISAGRFGRCVYCATEIPRAQLDIDPTSEAHEDCPR
jgi:DnaK suppressor protein